MAQRILHGWTGLEIQNFDFQSTSPREHAFSQKILFFPHNSFDLFVQSWAPLETCGSPPSSRSRSSRRQQNPVILATRNQWFFHFDCFNFPFKQAVDGTLADQSWYTQEIHLKVCMSEFFYTKQKQILPEEKSGCWIVCQIGFWIRCLLKTEDNANTCPHKTLKTSPIRAYSCIWDIPEDH